MIHGNEKSCPKLDQGTTKKSIHHSKEKRTKEDQVLHDTIVERNFPPLNYEFSIFLDILEIDSFLKKKFLHERNHYLVVLEQQIELEKKNLEKDLYLIEIKSIENNIQRLTHQYEKYKNNFYQNKYIEESKDVLELFKKLRPRKKTISFSMNQNDKKHNLSDEEEMYLTKVIQKYICIIKNYHDVRIIYPIQKFSCSICKKDLSKIIWDENHCNYCPRCGVEQVQFMQTTIVSDNKPMLFKDGYEDRENFEKALYRFQGKQVNHPPERLFKELDVYFTSFNPPLPKGDEIKCLPLTPKGGKKGTSKSMMLKALSETNNSVFYEDVNLVCHLYWGWTLPDLSVDEEQIMNDYDLTQEVYKKLPKDRKSSLNTQYRLWQHLKIRGYHYPIEDFKIVKTHDILVEHDKLMELMCKEIGLPFYPAI